jgi:hypothetical protein
MQKDDNVPFLCYKGKNIHRETFIFLNSFNISFLSARRKTGRIMLWRCQSVRPSVRPSVVILVFRTFFALFAAIELKLGVLLCSQELLFQFAFRCDWFIFARVMPLDLSRIADFFSVFRTFFAVFAAIGLKLGVLLCSQESLFQFTFRIDWLIFARVMPLELSRI